MKGDFMMKKYLFSLIVESAERHFGGLDKFDSGTRWPSFTTQGGGR
jgi:peptide methionine sulfoxide reductase MsrB